MKRLPDLLRDGGEIQLDRAALEIARIEYPNLDIEPLIGLLDSHAAELAGRLGGNTSGSGYLDAANRYLFQELGFKGNSEDYYDPRNSCLNDVLIARTGIPITLSVVYMEIARRLARPVFGIGLPGHFLVEYEGQDFRAYIDVFHRGRLLSAAQCYDLARQSTGEAVGNDARLLARASHRQIVARMLRNLKSVYLHRGAYAKALQAIDLLLAAEPDAAQEYRLRGLLQFQMGNSGAARADLETYLRLAPDASDRAEIEQRVQSLRGYQARMN